MSENSKNRTFPCHIYGIENAAEAWKSFDGECVKEYGERVDLKTGKTLHWNYVWDEGGRSLLRCRKCGGLLLIQYSEFHSMSDSPDGFYDDWIPVATEEEADLLNLLLDEGEMENYPARHLRANNGRLGWTQGEKPEPQDVEELKKRILVKYKIQSLDEIKGQEPPAGDEIAEEQEGISTQVDIKEISPEEMDKYAARILALRDLGNEHIVFENGEDSFYQVCVDHDDAMRTEINVNGRLYGRESTREEAVELFREYYEKHDSLSVEENYRMFEGFYTIFGMPDWDDITHVIWDEEVEKSLAEFLKNDLWKKYYETAPSDLCKKYISYEFYLSDGGDEAAESEMQAMEKRLTIEDWQHLYRYCGNNPRKAVIQRHIDELEQPPCWMIPYPMEETSWKRLFDREGNLAYEGFAGKHNVPIGAGTAFYPNGNRYKEGIWGYKGLLTGREYYPNGKLKFEGIYSYNEGYGPNYPVYGRLFSEKGILLFDGKLKGYRTGVGWPIVKEPEEYGAVVQKEAPSLSDLVESANEKR